MIRPLRQDDIIPMMEWMKDKNVTSNLQADFANMSEEKVKSFIENSQTDENVHFAIVDENDEYMGTISLKNIDNKSKNAEYAIVTRSVAHGKGYARLATQDILKYAFEELKLEKVYLYVSVNNIAANKFYQKCGFVEEGVFRKHLLIDGCLTDIKWYSMLKDDYT